MERGAEEAWRKKPSGRHTGEHTVCLVRYYIGVKEEKKMASYKLTGVELSNTMKGRHGRRTAVAGGTDSGSRTGCPQPVNKNSVCFLTKWDSSSVVFWIVCVCFVLFF